MASLNNVPIKAADNGIRKEPSTLAEYNMELDENAKNNVDLPLPSNTTFRKSWIETTKDLLQEKNNGYKVEKVIEEGNTVTFIFEPLTLEILDKIRKKDNGVLVKAFTAELISEQQFGYLASVTYETTATGQTRIDNWYNSEAIKQLDNSGTIQQYELAADMALTVLSIAATGKVAAALTVVELIRLCRNFADYVTVNINSNERYQVITHVENLYKTKQVWGYSGIVWVIGAQVQRHEQYKYIYTYKKNSSNTTVATYEHKNIPNSTLTNYDTYRQKTYYGNETWLKNRAIQVSAGQASVYYDLYKTFLPGTYY